LWVGKRLGCFIHSDKFLSFPTDIAQLEKLNIELRYAFGGQLLKNGRKTAFKQRRQHRNDF